MWEEQDAAREASESSSKTLPLPATPVSQPDPALQEIADHLGAIRRKQSIDFYAPGIGLLILIGLAYWFLHA